MGTKSIDVKILSRFYKILLDFMINFILPNIRCFPTSLTHAPEWSQTWSKLTERDQELTIKEVLSSRLKSHLDHLFCKATGEK